MTQLDRSKDMTATNQAREHIQRMEQRVRQQIEKVEQCERLGRDPAAEKSRLRLLLHALDEMRIQIGQLSPTMMDEKRDATRRRQR